jgi:serine/threonine protein kinase
MSVAHRDIKAENILINRKTWDIKYIDFGLSCYCKGDALTQSCLGPVGDPNYFDPLLAQYYPMVSQKLNNREIPKNEFYDMNSKYLKSSDLWSLGILMCMLITKTTPYRIITRKYDDLKVSKLSLTDEMKSVYSYNDTLFYYYPFYIQNLAIGNDAMKKYLTVSDMVFELISRANRKLGAKFYGARMIDLLSLDQNKRKIYIP